MNKDTFKEPGFCTCCDKLVFGVLSKFPRDHPRYGEILKLGLPDMDALRVTLTTVAGRLMSITLCADSDCEISDENLCDVFGKLKRTNARDYDSSYRMKMGAYTIAENDKKAYEDSIIQFMNDPPIGIHSVMTWREVVALETLRNGSSRT